MTTSKTQMSQTEWADAALEALATHGTAGVNIEQLARSLDTTKGSFYHHFENRQALLEAALARWEALIEENLSAPDVVGSRRERLIDVSVSGINAWLDNYVELALGSSIGEPAVATALRRVNSRRIEYLSSMLRDIGVPPSLSHSRAYAGLATFAGLCQLQYISGDRLSERELRGHVTRAVDLMLTI